MGNLVELANGINLQGSSIALYSSRNTRRYESPKYSGVDCNDNCDCHSGDCSDCYCMDCNEGSDED